MDSLFFPEPAFGLLQRLLAGIPVPVRQLLREIAIFAAKVHLGEIRKGPNDSAHPFIVHPLRLAISLVEEARVSKEDILAAALCHDTLEHDRKLTTAELIATIGQPAAKMVLDLSVPHKLTPGESPSASRVNYLNRLEHAGPNTLLVKAADRLDNLRHRNQVGPSDRLLTMIRQDQNDYVPLFRRALPREGKPLLERICMFL